MELSKRIKQLEKAIGLAIYKGNFAKAEELAAVRRQLIRTRGQ